MCVIEMTTVQPLTIEEKREHKYNGESGHAAAYVSTFAKYSAGSLAGQWVDLETFGDADELFDYLCRLHADECDPEFMFQDFENLPEKFRAECMCPDELSEMYAYFDLEDDDREIVGEYWDEIDSSVFVENILDRHIYSGDADDYFDELADEMLHDCPENLRYYFDYKAWERDCAFDYDVTSNHVFCKY